MAVDLDSLCSDAARAAIKTEGSVDAAIKSVVGPEIRDLEEQIKRLDGGPNRELLEHMGHYEDLAGGNPAAGFQPREKTVDELIADKSSMEEQIRTLKRRFAELEDLLVSARAIAQRRGEDTAWERFDERLAKAGIGSVTAKVFKVLPSDLE